MNLLEPFQTPLGRALRDVGFALGVMVMIKEQALPPTLWQVASMGYYLMLGLTYSMVRKQAPAGKVPTYTVFALFSMMAGVLTATLAQLLSMQIFG